MSDIDDVLERLVTDEEFRSELAGDPAVALAGYSLEEDDLEVLAATLDEGGAEEHGVEQRTSKSALLGMITWFAHGGGGSSPTADADLAAHETSVEPEGQASSGRVAYFAYELKNVQEEGVEALAAPESPDGRAAEGPAGLRSDGELVQASTTPDVPTAEEPPVEADPSRPTAEHIELVPHTITYAETSSYQEHIANEGFLAEADAPAEAEGSEIAIETVAIQNEGVDPEPDASVGSDETETVAASRDVSVKGSKVKEN